MKAESPMTPPFMEPLPPGVADRLGAAVAERERVLIQVATDMADRDTYERHWLVVTDRRVLLLAGNGAGGPGASGDGLVSVPLDQVRTARAEALVGGGRLEVERRDAAPTWVYYSSSLAPKFGEVAEGIRRLAAGEDLSLPTQLERSRCARCNRMLPEKGGVCPACTRKLDTLRRLLSYMLPYRGRVAGLVAILVTETLVGLTPPVITRHIVDDVLTPRDHFGLLVQLVAALLGINVLMWLAWVGRRWLGTTVGFRAIEALRGDLYRALQYLPVRFYDRRKVGSLISRMSNDSDLVEVYLIFDIPYIISNGLMVVGILGLLLFMNWELSIYVLLPVPPIVVASTLIWKRMEAYWSRWSSSWSRLSSHLNESIRGIRIVKAFAQEAREGDRFERRNAALRQVSV
ncbi:MAG: ABC transporter transmembrane domain-containing protein [Gemmatimonadota bacterium]